MTTSMPCIIPKRKKTRGNDHDKEKNKYTNIKIHKEREGHQTKIMRGAHHKHKKERKHTR
jgi:hypothetical protein